VELLHKGRHYQFEYDFEENCDPTNLHVGPSGRVLDGSVHITEIRRDGRLTPVPAEVLRLMEGEAVEDALARGYPCR